MDSDAKRPAPWLERFPSWVFLAILAGIIGLAFVLSWLVPSVFWSPPDPPLGVNDRRCDAFPATGHGFFYDYYWAPILCDEGYNAVNTSSWAVLLGLILLWAYRLTVELRERVDTGLILAVVPFLVWGSVYRVLEDSDLFAPYGAAQPGAPQGSGFLDQYLGIFFITPIIYVEITFIAVALLLWAHRAQRVADASGVPKGLRYYAYSLVILVALYAALWASEPTYIRWVADPWIAAAAALVAYWTAHRFAAVRGRVNPHVLLGAYGLFFLFIGAYYVFVWMTGGVDNWAPFPADAGTQTYPASDAPGLNWPVQWWIFLATVLAPGLVAYTVWRKGRILGGAEPHDPTKARSAYGRHVTVLAVVVLLEAIAVFLTILGMEELAQRQLANAWGVEPVRYVRTIALLAAGPLAIALGTFVTRRITLGRLGVHPLLLHYALPINLLMVFGQMTDALMTSLGIDLYHYSEKHVLPRFLIELVDGLGLPLPFGDYPTAMVMIPLKLLIVLLVVVAIDSSAQEELRGRENLVGLVKLGIIMVGLSPGVRDGVRLAMAT